MGETTVTKNAKGHGYNYADLASINEFLSSKGIEYYQYTDLIGENDYIFTVPIIEGKELAPRRGCRVVQATLVGSGKDNPAQKQGSALTYARRYSLLMAFGLAAEDDDAASLNGTDNVRKAQEQANKSSNKEMATEAQKKAIASACERRGWSVEALYKDFKTAEAYCSKERATVILTKINNEEYVQNGVQG